MPIAIQPITNHGKMAPAPLGINNTEQSSSSGAIRSHVFKYFGQFRRKIRLTAWINSHPTTKITSWPPGVIQNAMFISPYTLISV